jgi:serine/threonine protein kinase
MLGKLIGKGSFGRVYHAINLNADPVEMIAVKQVEIPTTKSDLMNERQRASIEALYHEISLLEGLDHENIVQYLGYDSNEAEGHLNIFLEYVAGGSISSCLTKFGPFKEPLLSHFTRQILQGLKYLHNKHILHRVSCHILLFLFTSWFINIWNDHRISKEAIFSFKKMVFAKYQISDSPN